MFILRNLLTRLNAFFGFIVLGCFMLSSLLQLGTVWLQRSDLGFTLLWRFFTGHFGGWSLINRTQLLTSWSDDSVYLCLWSRRLRWRKGLCRRWSMFILRNLLTRFNAFFGFIVRRCFLLPFLLQLGTVRLQITDLGLTFLWCFFTSDSSGWYLIKQLKTRFTG